MYDKKEWSEVVQKAFLEAAPGEFYRFLELLEMGRDYKEEARLELRSKIFRLRQHNPVIHAYFEMWVSDSDMSWEEMLMHVVIALEHTLDDTVKMNADLVRSAPMPPIVIPIGEPKNEML